MEFIFQPEMKAMNSLLVIALSRGKTIEISYPSEEERYREVLTQREVLQERAWQLHWKREAELEWEREQEREWECQWERMI